MNGETFSLKVCRFRAENLIWIGIPAAHYDFILSNKTLLSATNNILYVESYADSDREGTYRNYVNRKFTGNYTAPSVTGVTP